MNAFTIKDLEYLSGIKAHTIRIWEQRYSFLKPRRTDTNIRYYNADELKSVLNIALLNKYGYKISHIDKMSADEVRQKIGSLADTEAQQERLINDLVQFMIDMDVYRFEGLLNNHIKAWGMEKTVHHLIFPFLDKLCLLWMADHVNLAQEQLVGNIIRQKLIAGIGAMNNRLSVDTTIVLFLPEGEYHELGLLYMYYLLKARGVKVLYIGANVPAQDMGSLVRARKPDYLYTHISCLTDHFNLDRFMQLAHQKIPRVPLVISGHGSLLTHKRKLPPNVQLLRSREALQGFLHDLTRTTR